MVRTRRRLLPPCLSPLSNQHPRFEKSHLTACVFFLQKCEPSFGAIPKKEDLQKRQAQQEQAEEHQEQEQEPAQFSRLDWKRGTMNGLPRLPLDSQPTQEQEQTQVQQEQEQEQEHGIAQFSRLDWKRGTMNGLPRPPMDPAG